MALNLNTTFTPRINPPSAAYPVGSIKDETIPGVSNDGTLLQAIWANDWQGFSDALLAYAGITANNVADTALVSQRFNALLASILQKLPQADGYTAVAGERVVMDNTSAVANMNLPASPSDGNTVEVSGATLYSLNNVIVNGNGKDIMINADPQCILDDGSDNSVFAFTFDATDDLWKISKVAINGAI